MCPSVCVCLKEFLTYCPLGVITLHVSVAKSSCLSGLSGETRMVLRVRAVLTECAEMSEGVLHRFKCHLFEQLGKDAETSLRAFHQVRYCTVIQKYLKRHLNKFLAYLFVYWNSIIIPRKILFAQQPVWRGGLGRAPGGHCTVIDLVRWVV